MCARPVLLKFIDLFPRFPGYGGAVIKEIISTTFSLTVTSCLAGNTRFWMLGPVAQRPGWFHAKVPGREDTISSHSNNWKCDELIEFWIWSSARVIIWKAYQEGNECNEIEFQIEILDAVDQLTEGKWKCFRQHCSNSWHKCWVCVENAFSPNEPQLSLHVMSSGSFQRLLFSSYGFGHASLECFGRGSASALIDTTTHICGRLCYCLLPLSSPSGRLIIN